MMSSLNRNPATTASGSPEEDGTPSSADLFLEEESPVDRAIREARERAARVARDQQRTQNGFTTPWARKPGT
jgi:hypothetical protein